MSKWKGPVECARCKGLTLSGEEHLLVARLEYDDKGAYHSLYPYGDRCRGPFTPHDRRAHDPRVAALEGAARSACEALAVTKSWCPARGQGQIEAEAAIKAIDAALAALKGVEE